MLGAALAPDFSPLQRSHALDDLRAYLSSTVDTHKRWRQAIEHSSRLHSLHPEPGMKPRHSESSSRSARQRSDTGGGGEGWEMGK